MPVEIDNVIHQVYVLKRPYVDEFLCRMGELFECVLFTASLAKVSIYSFDSVANMISLKKVAAINTQIISFFYSTPIQWRIY